MPVIGFDLLMRERPKQIAIEPPVDYLTLRGGHSRVDSCQSQVDIHAIVACDGKVVPPKRGVPPLTNEVILLIKDTSLLFVVGTVPFAWFLVRPDPAADGWSPKSAAPRLLYLAIMAVAVVMGLQHVNVDITFVTQLVLILVGMVSAGLTLAFSLGARRHVANLLARRELSRLAVGDRVKIGDQIAAERVGAPAHADREHPRQQKGQGTDDDRAGGGSRMDRAPCR